MKSNEDLREIFRPSPNPEFPDEYRYIPETDLLWLDSMNSAYPWTFDEVSIKQKLFCKIGHHKGRMEVMGGEPCFFCSYCGEIIR